MKKILLLLLTFNFLLSTAHAQEYKKIDSLKKVLNTLPPLNETETDTLRIKAVIDIGKLFQNTKADSAIYWLSSIVDSTFSELKAKQNPRRSFLTANALLSIGALYKFQGDYTNAINYYEKSLKFNEVLGNKSGIAKCFMFLGVGYM